ncbi:MAG: RluA family pseudouridine synthase [Oscillospiraceae bacterium]|jgi:23S rRNA pseudouridine955/2504/2580 synthase|nr:RluA family pseudouridine synthase [Oscillospiraceae bacterium]
MRNLTIGHNDSGQRLDKFLQKATTLPPSLMHKYIRRKRIKLNQLRCQHNVILKPGDSIELFINDEFFVPVDAKMVFVKTTIKPEVIYEDTNIIIANKPPGQLVHEDKDEKVNTLINAIKKYLFHNGEYNPSANCFAPALCHRIDRNTSGLVLAAKNSVTLRVLNQKIKNRELEKSYLCVVHNIPRPKEAVLTAYLWKDEANNRAVISSVPGNGYKLIKTRYRVLRDWGRISLLEVDLITGRTHQIRAHLAYIGCPVLGDNKYGRIKNNRIWGLKSQALCATKLKFGFASDAGHLGYLQNREFVLDDIWFRDQFPLF